MTLIVVTKQRTFTFNADFITHTALDGMMYFTTRDIHGVDRLVLGVNIFEVVHFTYEHQ